MGYWSCKGHIDDSPNALEEPMEVPEMTRIDQVMEKLMVNDSTKNAPTSEEEQVPVEDVTREDEHKDEETHLDNVQVQGEQEKQ